VLNVVDNSRVGKQRPVLVDPQQSITERTLDRRVFSVVEQSAFYNDQLNNIILHFAQCTLTEKNKGVEWLEATREVGVGRGCSPKGGQPSPRPNHSGQETPRPRKGDGVSPAHCG